MKMVKAIISRGEIDIITKALSPLGISGMTLCEIKCPSDDTVMYRGIQSPSYISMIKIEIAVNDDKVDELVSFLSRDNIDPGVSIDKICVIDIKDSISIRTGEKCDKSS